MLRQRRSCEIVGSYILNLLGNILDKDLVGLYRDDGLAIVRNLSGPEIERKRKAIIKLFKECGLNITIQTNLKIVNFLDIEMNLGTGTYRPYRKPDNMPVYINRNSNHPPTIIKEIPKAIAKRISDISSSEVVFSESMPIYSVALTKSGFHDNTTFIPKTTNTKTNKKKTLKRKIIWFNPPYCLSVKTNVGRIFLELIKKHFPKGNSLNKIFNKNTIKVSYSCMGNISSIISSHNKNILNPVSNTKYGCNCRSKESCPLQNKYLTLKIVYRADVKNLTFDEKKFYLGVTETPFKERFGNHTRDFKYPKYRNSTELSKYIRELKDANISPEIEWSIVTKVLSKTQLNFCKLYLSEKFYVIKSLNDPNILNKKSELVNTCRHQSKLLPKSSKKNRYSERSDTMD